ncbi:MAG: YqeG family HAD IIIA-type phosphatase [bacterium]
MWQLLCPRLYVDSVLDIPLAQLQEHGIRGLIFDLDNTIIGWDRDHLDKNIEEWLKKLKELGFKVCLVSNNKKLRVTTFGRLLAIPAIPKAGKPRRRAFREAMEILGTKSNTTAVVGDQIFTDVLGGNRLGLYTVLVVPMGKREFIGTRVMRCMERFVLKNLTKRKLLQKNQIKN